MREFRFGIEEEFFLTNRYTGELKEAPCRSFLMETHHALGDRARSEMLQCQVETVTQPWSRPEEALREIMEMRNALTDVGKRHGIGIVAAGTHPLAHPERQKATRDARYLELAEELKIVGVGTPVSGLHVHVEVPEPDHRIRIMNRLLAYLPLLLAFSTSSPFWAGQDTGMLAYRHAINKSGPRTGCPDVFPDEQSYQRYLASLIDANIIKDASQVWWSIRPAVKYPTLELRVADSCTSPHDGIAIASLYRALVRHFCRADDIPEPTAADRALIVENLWQAERHGIDGTYLSPASGSQSFKDWFDETVAMTANDVCDLNLGSQIDHLRAIPDRGTSAHCQRNLYGRLPARLSKRDALRQVSLWLQSCTEAGDLLQPENDRRANHIDFSAGAAL